MKHERNFQFNFPDCEKLPPPVLPFIDGAETLLAVGAPVLAPQHKHPRTSAPVAPTGHASPQHQPSLSTESWGLTPGSFDHARGSALFFPDCDTLTFPHTSLLQPANSNPLQPAGSSPTAPTHCN